jgi:hypothetical protein
VKPAIALLAAHLSALTAFAQLNVSGNFAVSTPDTAPSSQSITALNGAAQIVLAGQAGAGVTHIRDLDRNSHS